MDSSTSGRPRSRRSQSGLTKISGTDEIKADWKEQSEKLSGSGSLKAPQHRHSRSMHHHNHHHLHLHGSHSQTRQRSQTYGKSGSDRYLVPDGAMERLKKVGSKVKEHSGSSNASNHNRKDAGNITQEMQALQLARMSARVTQERGRAEARNRYGRLSFIMCKR
jgi:hypothetical protein